MPQLESIAQLTPMARAPPACRVFATALEPRLTTAASRSRIEGRTEQIMIQVETMLADSRGRDEQHLRTPSCPCMLAHTLR